MSIMLQTIRKCGRSWGQIVLTVLMSQKYVHSFIKLILLNLIHSSHSDKWNKLVFLWVHLCRGMKLESKDEQFHGSLVFHVNTLMSSLLLQQKNIRPLKNILPKGEIDFKYIQILAWPQTWCRSLENSEDPVSSLAMVSATFYCPMKMKWPKYLLRSF